MALHGEETIAQSIIDMINSCKKHLPDAAMWLLLLVVPTWVPPIYDVTINQIVVIGFAVTSMNWFYRQTGIFSFGHAAYFGLGVYIASFFLRYQTYSPTLAIVAGTLSGGCVGTLFGGSALLVIRKLPLRWGGPCFAVATLIFAETCRLLLHAWTTIDLSGPGPGLLGKFDLVVLYYCDLAVFAAGATSLTILQRSSFGHAPRIVPEKVGATPSDLQVTRRIWLTFSISCFLTALAGALGAFSDPQTLVAFEVFPDHLSLVGWPISIEFVAIAVMGGVHTFWGPTVGAAVAMISRELAIYPWVHGYDTLASIVAWGPLGLLILMSFPKGILIRAQEVGNWLLHARWRRSVLLRDVPYLRPYAQYLLIAPLWWKLARALAVVITILAIILFTGLTFASSLGLNLVLKSNDLPELDALAGIALAFIVNALLFIPCFVLFTGMTAKEGIAALHNDRRKPVLFLRSFKSDAGFWKSVRDLVLRRDPAELSLVRAISTVGPVVALGQPGEKLKPNGAARLQVEHEHWQDVVRTLEREASLVVLRVGETESFWWELEYLIKTAQPQKVLIYFPPEDHGNVYAHFQYRAAHMLPKALPSWLSDETLLLCFGADWSPRQVSVQGPSKMATLRKRWLRAGIAPAIHEALVEGGYAQGPLALAKIEWIALIAGPLLVLFPIWMVVQYMSA